MGTISNNYYYYLLSLITATTSASTCNYQKLITLRLINTTTINICQILKMKHSNMRHELLHTPTFWTPLSKKMGGKGYYWDVDIIQAEGHGSAGP